MLTVGCQVGFAADISEWALLRFVRDFGNKMNVRHLTRVIVTLTRCRSKDADFSPDMLDCAPRGLKESRFLPHCRTSWTAAGSGGGHGEDCFVNIIRQSCTGAAPKRLP